MIQELFFGLLGFFFWDVMNTQCPMMCKSKVRAFAPEDVTLSRTCEAGGPGDVQVEVLGGVNEHVKVPVGLRREKRRQRFNNSLQISTPSLKS